MQARSQQKYISSFLTAVEQILQKPYNKSCKNKKLKIKKLKLMIPGAQQGHECV
jgi:hypothetical protein